MVQFTALLLLPVTVAVNCCVCPCDSVADAGLTDTPTGGMSVIVALADLVGSAALVAVTITACCDPIDAGAVYRPAALTVPTLGAIDHVTALLLLPVTVALNC